METTFNDLLKPHQKRFDYHNSQRIYIDKADVLKLMQQVREATIAECWETVRRVAGFVDAYEFSQDFNDIKKDSIQIEEYTFNPEEDENLPF